MNEPLKPIGRFILELLVATALFVVIAIPAVGLNYLASSDLLASTSALMRVAIKYMGDAMFLLDTLLFAIYMLRTTLSLARSIWSFGEEESK